MAQTALRGNPIQTVGELPAVGSPVPSFTVTGGNLGRRHRGRLRRQEPRAQHLPEHRHADVRDERAHVQPAAAGLDDTVVLCVSADLPFAQNRFCGAEGIENVKTGSTFRSDFGEQFGVDAGRGPDGRPAGPRRGRGRRQTATSVHRSSSRRSPRSRTTTRPLLRSAEAPDWVSSTVAGCGLGEVRAAEPLAGGVSSDVWRVDVDGRSVCVKRPCHS